MGIWYKRNPVSNCIPKSCLVVVFWLWLRILWCSVVCITEPLLLISNCVSCSWLWEKRVFVFTGVEFVFHERAKYPATTFAATTNDPIICGPEASVG